MAEVRAESGLVNKVEALAQFADTFFLDFNRFEFDCVCVVSNFVECGLQSAMPDLLA